MSRVATEDLKLDPRTEDLLEILGADAERMKDKGRAGADRVAEIQDLVAHAASPTDQAKK